MAETFLPYTTDLVTALGWAILHSLWQALVVFICLRIVLKLWPGATASVKYNLSFFSMAGIFGWFVVTLYQQLAAVKQAQAAVMPLTWDAAQGLSKGAPFVYQNQQQITWMFPGMEMYFPILVGLYVAGVGVMCIKLVADLAQLQQIRKKQILPVDAAWEHYLDKLKLQLRIPRKVQLLISQYVQVPVMMGFLKPVILVPAAMFNNLSPEQLEAILLHELAHIKRNDYILNIFQSIVETTLFFNPFVWWISKCIRLEREHCCDDMVIAHTAQPLHYAKALVALEEYRFTTNPMAMAAADDKQHLFYRIKRIMEMKTTHLNYSQKLMAMLIIAVGLTAIAWITPSAKQDNKAIAAAGPHMIAPVSDTVPPKQNKASDQRSSDKWENNTDADKDNEQAADKREANREEMEKAHDKMRDAHEQMRVANDAAQKAMHDALKNIDWNTINAQTQQALKAVDWKKINAEVENSLKAIDWKKINAEVEASIKESKQSVDPEMIRQSVELGLKSAQTAMASLDIEGIIKQSMAHAQRGLSDAQREMMRRDMDKAREEQRESMKEMRSKMDEVRQREREVQREEANAKRAEMSAKRAEEKAEVTRKEYQELISRLAADNLIDPAKSYTIEKKNNQLYINGTLQPDAVMDKYRSYLHGEKVTIQGKSDNMNIHIK